MMIRFIKNFHLGKIFKLINLFFIPWNLRTVHFTLPRLFISIVKKKYPIELWKQQFRSSPSFSSHARVA